MPMKLVLDKFGYEIRLKPSAEAQYIDPQTTIAAAESQGKSVIEYLADLWHEHGVVERVINFLLEQAPLSTNPVVLEIGPGTGRFLEPVLNQLKPSSYEIYETSPGWSNYLARTYPVKEKRTGGNDLFQTADGICDLVHVHGVFVFLPVIATFAYFREICRVLKPGGYVMFDVFLDDQVSLDLIEAWTANNVN
jgi:SAM-dependent methyltransferase